jgi:hypothetical protein
VSGQGLQKEFDMKKSFAIVALLTMICSISSAQFKSQVQQENQVNLNRFGDSSPLSFMFGWFNPEKFSMRHTFDMSFSTFGGQSLSLGSYTNSMRYDFADNLNARADVSFSFSPYNSLSQFNKNDFSKVYLSRAEVNYKPWENTYLSLSYRQLPYGSYYYSPFYSPWHGENNFGFEKK